MLKLIFNTLLIRTHGIFLALLTSITFTDSSIYNLFVLFCVSNMAKVDSQGPSFQLLVNEFSNIVVDKSDDPWASSDAHMGCRRNVRQGIKNVEALNSLQKLAQKLLKC